MKFINYAKYGDLDKIARARAAHFAYADRLREHGKLAIGGPLMDDQGQRIRLLFVYEAVSRDEALAFAQEDPFAVANAWSGYEISEWRLRGANLDLLIEANRAAQQSGGENTQSRMFVNTRNTPPTNRDSRPFAQRIGSMTGHLGTPANWPWRVP
jgi:uncharacterized protein YciI